MIKNKKVQQGLFCTTAEMGGYSWFFINYSIRGCADAWHLQQLDSVNVGLLHEKTLPLVAIAVGIAISSTANAQESAQVEQAQQPGAVSIRLSALTSVSVPAEQPLTMRATRMQLRAMTILWGLRIYAGYQLNLRGKGI